MLGCFARAFSSCSQQGLLWLQSTGSRMKAQYLWSIGLVALWHVGSSRTRDRTHVSCLGRQILIHSAIREVPGMFLFILCLAVL